MILNKAVPFEVFLPLYNLPASQTVMEGRELPEQTASLSAGGDSASTKTNGSPTFGFNVLWNRPPLTKMKEIIKKQFAGIGVHVFWKQLIELCLVKLQMKE